MDIQFSFYFLLGYAAMLAVVFVALAGKVTLSKPIRAVIISIAALPDWRFFASIVLGFPCSMALFTTKKACSSLACNGPRFTLENFATLAAYNISALFPSITCFSSSVSLRSHECSTLPATAGVFIFLYLRCLAGKLLSTDTHNSNSLDTTLTCPTAKLTAIPLYCTRINIKDGSACLAFPAIQRVQILLRTAVKAFTTTKVAITGIYFTRNTLEGFPACIADQKNRHDKTSYCGTGGLFRDHCAAIGGVPLLYHRLCNAIAPERLYYTTFVRPVEGF